MVVRSGRTKSKISPWGGSKPKAQRGGIFLPPGRPKAKKRPLGGQQAKGAAWGHLFAAGPPQGKKRPLGGQQAKGPAWGHSSFIASYNAWLAQHLTSFPGSHPGTLPPNRLRKPQTKS